MQTECLMDDTNPLERRFVDPTLEAAYALHEAWADAASRFGRHVRRAPVEMTVAQQVHFRVLNEELAVARISASEIDRLRRQVAELLAKYEAHKRTIAYLVTQLHLPPAEPAPTPTEEA